MTAPKTSNISIIIPALNEQDALGRQLADLAGKEDLQIIVVDGGSVDRTAETARQFGAELIVEPTSRGKRLNLGAAAATGDFLLFLHCDTRLPHNFTDVIHRTLARPGTAAGAFRLRIGAPGIGFRLVEQGANLRSRLLQLPYGDQGIFLRRETFTQVGGFAELPIMEDLELIRRLKSCGAVRTAPEAVTTSARRWRELGIIRTTFINQAMLIGLSLGRNPHTLRQWYYRRTAGAGKRAS